jgi:hypothetical protein
MLEKSHVWNGVFEYKLRDRNCIIFHKYNVIS